jgi:hypothetical protein
MEKENFNLILHGIKVTIQMRKSKGFLTTELDTDKK